MRPSRCTSASAAILAGALLSACSVLNAPDDVVPGGDGGAGPTTGAAGGDPASTTSAGGDGGGGAASPACESPADCGASECEAASCDAGRCVVTPLPFGTSCGPDAAECQAGGACDGSGACVVPDLEGATCASCDGDPAACVCRGGACATCTTFASVNTFSAPDLPGWELTGGWGLYTRFPRDRQAPSEVPIGDRVLGTDGNRSRPYPGGEDPAVGGSLEQSSATSPPGALPDTLTFRSWHEDEGGAATGRDNKRIVAVVGDAEHVVVDCAAGVRSDLPFCQPPPAGLAAQRAPDAWDEVSIELPTGVAGEEGRLRFEYDSVDATGARERGWFIDDLGAAGRCGCTADADCAHLSDPCAEGVCDAGACRIAPRAGAEGTACGSAEADACSAADRCDAAGICDAADRVDGTACNACDGGDCQVCGAGACVACEAELQTFDGLAPLAGWQLEGGWGVQAAAPARAPLPAVVFPSSMLGTDGAAATSTATSIPTVIPETLTFSSWHVDEGGASGDDNKTIIVVVDGETFTLLDCAGGVGDALPPCAPRVGPRDAADRDVVSLPTGEAAGLVGTIVFGYAADAAGATPEQGWYVDDLNAVRCP